MQYVVVVTYFNHSLDENYLECPSLHTLCLSARKLSELDLHKNIFPCTAGQLFVRHLKSLKWSKIKRRDT